MCVGCRWDADTGRCLLLLLGCMCRHQWRHWCSRWRHATYWRTARRACVNRRVNQSETRQNSRENLKHNTAVLHQYSILVTQRYTNVWMHRIKDKKAVLSQRWPRDAPRKVNKQSHLHLRLRDSRLTQFNRTLWTYRCWTNIFSPKFLHILLGVGGWPLGYEQRGCWANCSCNYFSKFSTYVVTIHQRHSLTDRQTDRQVDRQTTCDRRTVLCTVVHCAIKTQLQDNTENF